jgi:hypothetical protein
LNTQEYPYGGLAFSSSDVVAVRNRAESLRGKPEDSARKARPISLTMENLHSYEFIQ